VGPNGFSPAYAFRSPLHDVMRMARAPLDSVPDDVAPAARAARAAIDAMCADACRDGLNPVVLEDPDGLSVYVLQGSKDSSVIFMGGDERFRFDRSGRQVLERERIHNSLIEIRAPRAQAGTTQPAASVHSHVLHNRPQPSEVAKVILEPSLAPHYIGFPDGAIFRVDADGTIWRMQQ
jgi:hypothetical protein